jgi:hypothetical protein
MQVKEIILLAMLGMAIKSYSQVTAPLYGRVNIAEVTMKEYTGDKTCEAVVLYDVGKSYFRDTENGFELVFERRTKIKIFSKSGLRWAEIEIPYYTEGFTSENVSDIEAASYNLENDVIRQTFLDPKKVFDEKTSDHYRQKKFAIPNVKEGSVIEYKYSIASPYMFNLQDWQFQRTIPTVYSEYLVKITPFYEYIYIMTGQKYLTVKESYVDGGLPRNLGAIQYQDMVHRFVMKNLPAFSDESYITSINDYIYKADFQLSHVHHTNGVTVDIITTWPKMITEMMKHEKFGDYINKAEKACGSLAALPELTGKSQTEQLEILVNQVKSGFSWNGDFNEFATKSVKEFMKEKTGNSADINLYLTGLLRAAGFDAYPVIISTRGHGKIKSDYPFAHFFNDVIILVTADGKQILTDATQVLCPFNTIPPWCINEKGLVIKKDAEDWVMLSNNDPSTLNSSFIIRLAPENDTVRCIHKVSATNYDAFNFRKNYQDDSEKVEKYFHDKGYTGIDSIRIVNFDDPRLNYSLKVDLRYPAEKTEDKIYLSPFMLEAPEENFLKQTVRQYPVDMTYLKSRMFNSVISIPDGYSIEYLPADSKIESKFLDAEFASKKIGENTLIITARYTYKKVVYEPEDYSNLRYTLNEIIKKLNEKVVLKKI